MKMNGVCGDNLTWTLDGGTLLIRGNGNMKNFSFDDEEAPWFTYRKNVRTVVVESGVTSVGDRAFMQCKGLTAILIPDSVISVGVEAFIDCKSLQGFLVDEGNANYASLDGVLFSKDRSRLVCYPAGKGESDYTIPDGVTTVESGAFLHCKNLSAITIPESVITMAKGAFSGCNVKDVYYDGAKADRTAKLETNDDNFELANAAWHYRVFTGTCGDDLTWTLKGRTLTICGNGDMEYYGKAPWQSYSESIQTVAIENGVTSINDFAFERCGSLTAVTIPDSVTYIGENAFYFCNSLTAITIPESVTCIGNGAFYGCNSLTSIFIPSSVTSIGSTAFCGGHSLQEILVDAGNPNYISDDGILFTKDMSEILCYPAKRCEASYIIPDGVNAIGEAAFLHCSSLTLITIPDSVTTIGSGAFFNCCNLPIVTISSNVISIEDCVFSRCSNLQGIWVDADNPKYASENGVLFTDDKSEILCCPAKRCGTTYVIPDSVTYVWPNAFLDCTSLEDVYYDGTEKDRARELSIDANNSALRNAEWHYRKRPLWKRMKSWKAWLEDTCRKKFNRVLKFFSETEE